MCGAEGVHLRCPFACCPSTALHMQLRGHVHQPESCDSHIMDADSTASGLHAVFRVEPECMVLPFRAAVRCRIAACTCARALRPVSSLLDKHWPQLPSEGVVNRGSGWEDDVSDWHLHCNPLEIS